MGNNGGHIVASKVKESLVEGRRQKHQFFPQNSMYMQKKKLILKVKVEGEQLSEENEIRWGRGRSSCEIVWDVLGFLLLYYW